MKDLTPFAIGIFVLAVFPGLVSTTIYRLIMPARAMEWGNAIVQGLFYSTVNLLLALPVLAFVVYGHDPADSLGRYIIGVIAVFIIGPIIWPVVLVALFKSKWVAARVQIPYPTAWDYFFDNREPAFVLVHLNEGALLGGYWGGNSYAGSYPNDGDIYLEAVYSVDDEGKFGEPMPNTRGVLLRKDQYSYVELFSVPESGGSSDEQGQGPQPEEIRQGGIQTPQ
jgi:hypothetical protein